VNTISAIETAYKGYRFRSRLEARWAMFFDLTGVPWVYEPECLKVDGEPYLPDFRLWGDVTHEVKSRHEWERIQPPRVYLAGKMKEAHEWRGEAAVCERHNRKGAAYSVAEWAPRMATMCGASFMHVGPFSIANDHGSAHCESAAHMAQVPWEEATRQDVMYACLEKIAACDLFCAHLNTADAFGTLVEIGYAAALNKKVAVTILRSVADAARRPSFSGEYREPGTHDFWFAQEIAYSGYVVADDDRARAEHSAFIRRHMCREYRLISGIGLGERKACITFGDPLDVATHGETHEFGASVKKWCIAHRGAAEQVRGHRFDAR
jgi:nucleoside 2-deoxyribosyltransferase